MTEKIKRILILVVIATMVAATGCVPARKYEELVERRDICESQNTELKQENETLFTQNNELRSQRDQLQEEIGKLKTDTTRVGIELRRLRENYDRLAKTYEIVLDHNEKLLEGKEMETSRIIRELQATQEDLQRREDELRKATAAMLEKEKNLNALNERLQNTAQELTGKQQRVDELESIIARQDSTVQALKRSISNALLGFEGQGLTVEIKNGKVYVSMEERLLFATGSTTVDPQGVNALRQLAKVLEANPDINILIEGHTDDVPFRPGSQIRDNWDLSVLRATAIVRIILQNSNIAPQRLTAAGKGEYMPLDPGKTPEARRKNRRTEIILTPKLDDLFQIIEIN
ncbi:MAG: OmpA family protein [Bacteroidota bacterium]